MHHVELLGGEDLGHRGVLWRAEPDEWDDDQREENLDDVQPRPSLKSCDLANIGDIAMRPPNMPERAIALKR